MKLLLTILILSGMLVAKSQDSIKVKITRVVKKDSVTHVWMRTEKGDKLYTACKCVVLYKEKETVWIKNPTLD